MVMRSENMDCKHDYSVLDKEITVEQTIYEGEMSNMSINGYVVFYCRKCTEIQKAVLDNA